MCAHTHASDPRQRAAVLLALFALVWLQLLVAGHGATSRSAALRAVDDPPKRLSDARAIEALIAGSWCGSSNNGGPDAPTGDGHGAGLCLHCATGCHASAGGTSMWSWIGLPSGLYFAGSNGVQRRPISPQWLSGNRTRGPPLTAAGV